MKRTSVIILLLLNLFCISANNLTERNDTTDSLKKKESYSFIIQDSPTGLFTMRQFNQNYLSSYRLLSAEINKLVSGKLSRLIQCGMELILYPLTHEEGHRSILTSLGIGSVSQPFYNLKGTAYVKGVRNAELQNLRDTDLPNYIRLHTAGIESDYILGNRIEEMLFFDQDTKRNLLIELHLRKLTTMAYYSSGLFPKLFPNIKEEPNESDRDIVGHDVYGAIKNLHRPSIPFYRYTDYGNLTVEEHQFVKRVGYRALLNLASPAFFNSLNIIRKEKLKLSVSAGYIMCPFGDMIDEHFLFQYDKKYNIHAYLRQFENRNTWFMGGGLSLIDYQLSPKFNATISGHFWNQPRNFDFNTTDSQFGGSGDLLFKYLLLENKSRNSMSVDLGVNYKTVGFLPEEVIMKNYFGIRLGVTLNLVQK